jgi:hypothetical protein
MPRTLSLALVLALLAAVLLGTTAPRLAEHYEVHTSSRFWIDGTATTGPYSCEAGRVGGYGRLSANPAEPLEVQVRVPVAAFDCGVSRMNRDFQAALQGDAHPNVRFDLDRADVIDGQLRRGEWVRVRAVGTLHLAGTSRQIAVQAEGKLLADDRVRIRGRHPLLMSDFGIDPPSGLLGLVRAHDRVVARFDLVAAAR